MKAKMDSAPPEAQAAFKRKIYAGKCTEEEAAMFVAMIELDEEPLRSFKLSTLPESDTLRVGMKAPVMEVADMDGKLHSLSTHFPTEEGRMTLLNFGSIT